VQPVRHGPSLLGPDQPLQGCGAQRRKRLHGLPFVVGDLAPSGEGEVERAANLAGRPQRDHTDDRPPQRGDRVEERGVRGPVTRLLEPEGPPTLDDVGDGHGLLQPHPLHARDRHGARRLAGEPHEALGVAPPVQAGVHRTEAVAAVSGDRLRHLPEALCEVELQRQDEELVAVSPNRLADADVRDDDEHGGHLTLLTDGCEPHVHYPKATVDRVGVPRGHLLAGEDPSGQRLEPTPLGGPGAPRGPPCRRGPRRRLRRSVPWPR